MGAYNFVYILAEHQIAHLTACVYAVDWLKGLSVPKPDASVSSSSS